MTYDAGILNDFGGGNIQWWHDYIRSLLGLSDEHWLDEVNRFENELEGLQAENERLKNALEIATDYVKKESTRTTIGQLYDIEQALKG